MKDNNIRERIIEAGRERFFAKGFSKVTMDELVNQLGISKKTMYKYFPSKDDLVESISEWQRIRIMSKVKEIVNSELDFIEKIHNLWAFIGESYSRISKQYYEDMRRFRPDLWKRIESFRDEHVMESARKLVDQGIKRGVFRDDVNKEILALVYVSAVQGILNPDVLTQHSFSAQEALNEILRIVFDGTLTDDARREYRAKCCPDNKATARAK